MNDSTDTRARILSTAQRLFHSRGYTDVGINDICREAGVVKGSFYHFFSGKQTLLEAVVEANAEALNAGLDALVTAPSSGRDKLCAQLRGVLANARRQQAEGAVLGCNLGSLASELAVHNDGARRVALRAFDRWLETLEKLVREGKRDGSLARELNARQTAAGLLAIIQGVSTLGRTFNDLSQLEDIMRIAEQRLLPKP